MKNDYDLYLLYARLCPLIDEEWYEKNVKKVLKAEGIIASRAKSGSIIIPCRSPVLKFIAFSVALSRHDRFLMEKLSKTAPVDTTVRLHSSLQLRFIVQFSVGEVSMNLPVKSKEKQTLVTKAEFDLLVRKVDALAQRLDTGTKQTASRKRKLQGTASPTPTKMRKKTGGSIKLEASQDK